MAIRKHYVSTIHDLQYKEIIKELVALRKKAGLKQEEIAEVIGLTQPDISKIERYERRIDALELAKWIKVTKGKFDAIIQRVF
jgi:transcriptional regulator with XRE-family HTH domain